MNGINIAFPKTQKKKKVIKILLLQKQREPLLSYMSDPNLLDFPETTPSEIGSAQGGQSQSGWIWIVVGAIVVFGLIMMCNNSKKNASAMKKPMSSPPSLRDSPPRDSPPRMTLPTSAEARPQQINAPEPAPYNTYSGREPQYAEYVPGQNYNLAYRQPQNQVKISLIECKSADMFHEIVIKNKKDVVCAFTSEGCGHCKQMKPEFLKAAEKSMIPFLNIDAKVAGPDMLKAYNIQGFPTVILFRSGQPISEFKNMPRTADNFLAFAQ